MPSTDSAKRIALNTGFLYSRMLITIFISLYSTRLILAALGVEDFGIFNLVAGVIGMLAFLNGAMAVSTQRYLSYYLGEGVLEKQKEVFNASVLLHMIIGAVVVLLLEVLGIFIFDGVLNIPEERVPTAKIVYHFMVVSTFFTINAVPYDASINAHENMLLDSIIGVFESLMKLSIAIWLVHAQSDKLILYGLLFACLTIIVRIIKSVYCMRYYPECTMDIKKYYNPGLFKEMFSFSVWNLFGASSNVIRNQGLAIILNLYHGVIANTAYGVANQVSGQLSAFSMNIVRAINPQIIKSEGGGDRQRMLKLATLASKLSFFLLSFFAVPIILEMNFILGVWLKEVPEYAVIYCQLILVVSLLKQITWGLMTAVQSTGKIKAYQSVVSTLLILNLPLAIVLMKIGLPSYSVFFGVIFLEIVAALARVYFARRIAGLNAREFLIKTILYSLLSVGLAFSIAAIPLFYKEAGWVRLNLIIFISFALIIIFGKHIAFTREENSKIHELGSYFFKKIINALFKKT